MRRSPLVRFAATATTLTAPPGQSRRRGHPALNAREPVRSPRLTIATASCYSVPYLFGAHAKPYWR